MAFSGGTIRQMYVAEGTGGSKVRPIRPWPHPKPLKGANMYFGPTQNVMNVIMNGRVIKKFLAVLAVLRLKSQISRLWRRNIYQHHVNQY